MHDKAYAAGVIDCDGSMGGYLSGRNEVLQLIVVVGVIDARLPIWLMERYGGKVRLQVKPQAHPEYRTMYRWELNGLAAAAFVKTIKPHLVIKAEQAEVFLKLAKTVTSNGKRLSPESKATRRTLVAELSALK